MTERTLTIEGVDIPLTELGTGPTLLWLHGYDSHPGEEDFLGRLARHYRVIAPVHPGFAEVSRLPWVQSMEDMAFYYRHVLAQVAAGERVMLAGHSLGGWIAAEFAVRFSHLLRGLVLVAPFGLRSEQAPAADLFMLTAVDRRERAWHDAAAAPAPDHASLRAIRDLEMTAQLGWEPRLFDPRLAGRLRWVDVPVLLVWGEQDRIVPLGCAQTWLEHLRAARQLIVPDAGHYPHVEHAASCANAIRGLAAGRDPGPAAFASPRPGQ
jgi:pimeloyl-ACP methyl ester carboxylesterase